MDHFFYASLFPHHHCLYNIDNIDVLCVVCAIQKRYRALSLVPLY